MIFNRVFHEINHPFWGPTPILGNIHISISLGIPHQPGSTSSLVNMRINTKLWGTYVYKYRAIQGGPPTSYKWTYGAPISRVKSPQLPIYKAIYRDEITPFITIVGAHFVTSVTYLFSAIYRGPISSHLSSFRGPPCG